MKIIFSLKTTSGKVSVTTWVSDWHQIRHSPSIHLVHCSDKLWRVNADPGQNPGESQTDFDPM